jgi:uncharacterized membrane protein (DUF2068 family)
MRPVATEPRRQPDDDSGPPPDRGPERPCSPAATFWIRAIALLEGAKGLLVLAAGTGLLYLVDKDVQSLAARLIAHLNLDPAHHYPGIFLKAADNATPERLRILAFGAFLYAAFRLVEGVGLWYRRRWAEWLAVLTGLFYVPFEIAAFIHRPRYEPVLALVVNLAVVLFLAFRLKAGDWTKRKK